MSRYCNRVHTDLSGRRICSQRVFAEGLCKCCFYDYCNQMISIEICTLIKRSPRRKPIYKKRLLNMKRFVVTRDQN